MTPYKFGYKYAAEGGRAPIDAIQEIMPSMRTVPGLIGALIATPTLAAAGAARAPRGYGLQGGVQGALYGSLPYLGAGLGASLAGRNPSLLGLMASTAAGGGAGLLGARFLAGPDIPADKERLQQ